MKTRVAMMFGGKTVEHEVSVISGIQALKAMDTEKYEVIPVYMTKENDMYIGSDIGDIKAHRDIQALLKKSQRVIMVNDNGRVQLVQPEVHLLEEIEVEIIDAAGFIAHPVDQAADRVHSQAVKVIFRKPVVGG